MTQQEKMNEIYELTGLEPDWWVHVNDYNQTALASSKILLIADNITQELFNLISDKPHYTESKLWEMLPETVVSNGDDEDAEKSEWIRVIETDGVKYIQEMYGNIYDLVVFEFDLKKGYVLHEALVDLVLWCISEGHIKKKGEAHE